MEFLYISIDMNTKLRVISGQILARATQPIQKENLDRSGNYSATTGFLKAIWRWVAAPFCEALNFTRKHWEETFNKGQISACRIWRMFTGDFVRLPMHAADRWTGDCNYTVFK